MGAAEADRLDRNLVEQAQRGDREAFATLARSRGDRLMQIAQRILRDVSRAEDAVQQTLVSAWRELPSLRDPERFDAWLHRLLTNAAYAEARRSRAWSANVRALPLDGPAGPDESVPVDDRDRLERAFRRLPPDQRAMLVFTHYLGLTPTEIADRLGIPIGTANSRLHYAHRAMRAAIDADERPVAVVRGRIR
ncbi:MAG: polymerase sigma-70 factor, subfamily [Chloroflexota bacterium]|jgi:RNA polymerase sigma-70 factor (ECF subfamily)|nr:polymerase sigma-70 factor, subfamily [Chloroflexota bacterium]